MGDSVKKVSDIVMSNMEGGATAAHHRPVRHADRSSPGGERVGDRPRHAGVRVSGNACGLLNPACSEAAVARSGSAFDLLHRQGRDERHSGVRRLTTVLGAIKPLPPPSGRQISENKALPRFDRRTASRGLWRWAGGVLLPTLPAPSDHP